MVSQVVAMVGSEHDYCVFPETLFLETIHYKSKLSIDKADAGMIGLDVFFSKWMILLGEFKPEGLVAFGQGRGGEEVPQVWPICFVGDFVKGIKIEVLIGSKKGDMRFL
jgi:hypothetical protein